MHSSEQRSAVKSNGTLVNTQRSKFVLASPEQLHTQHVDRAFIQDEAHARPPVAVEWEAGEAWHWVLHTPQFDANTWPSEFDLELRHQLIERPDGILRFERHTEFVSLTFFGEHRPSLETLDLVRRCPGNQLSGARILVSETISIENAFGDARIFGGNVMFEGIAATTDFRVSDHGLVKYTVSGKFEDGFARGRLIKRLLDLETYRMACLLGLPAVRRLTPKLHELESRAEKATSILNQTQTSLDEPIRELANILKSVSAIRSELYYRIAASNAYYDLVSDRLTSLDETQIGQRQTLRGFIKHRLDPGMKTIRAFERRAESISTSISEALALVRTQLDHTAQQQSQNLLASMEQRARQQVHLAQAVEGLSVAAITYYSVGLISYLLRGAPPLILDHSTLIAFSVIPVAVCVAWFTRRARKKIDSIARR